MDAHKEFDINIHIEKWQSEIENVDSLTEGDREELKSHFLDIFDSLKAKDLDDEEAFLVTKKRLGKSSDWDEDYQTVNNPLLQMRKSLVVFMGVLLYFFTYYLFGFTSKLLYILLHEFGVDGYICLAWLIRYLIFVHFVFILLVAAIYFFDQKVINLLYKLEFRFNKSLTFLLSTFILGMLNTFSYVISKNISMPDVYLKSRLSTVFGYYENYTFPILICISFFVLYVKYKKKI